MLHHLLKNISVIALQTSARRIRRYSLIEIFSKHFAKTAYYGRSGKNMRSVFEASEDSGKGRPSFISFSSDYTSKKIPELLTGRLKPIFNQRARKFCPKGMSFYLPDQYLSAAGDKTCFLLKISKKWHYSFRDFGKERLLICPSSAEGISEDMDRLVTDAASYLCFSCR